jgi:hypothetical protein
MMKRESDNCETLDLPDDLWIAIHKHLNSLILIRLAVVSKRWLGFLAWTVRDLVAWPQMSDQMLQRYASLAYLYFLDHRVSYKAFTDEGLLALRNLRTLVNPPRQVTDRAIRSLTRLTSLVLRGYDNALITDNGLSTLTQLAYLAVEYGRYSDQGLSTLTNLTCLDMQNSGTLTDAGLGQLTNLTELILEECRHVTDIGFQRLTHLTRLVYFCKGRLVTNEGLSGLVNLQSLSLTNVHLPITNAAFQHLDNLTFLRLYSKSRRWIWCSLIPSTMVE